jgi:protein-S-isoprenylcysteine O-methyltransferase Ste14
VITVIAQFQMGAAWRIGIDNRPNDLVTAGLFGVCRNPIFSGMILTLAGTVAVTPAILSLTVAVAATVLIAAQVRLEEQHLLGLHGESYRNYAERVGRFMPLLGRIPR